jgi:HSP20 family protein
VEICQYGPGRHSRYTGINWPWDNDRTVKRIPLADISQGEKEYLIRVELPEVKEEDVKVTVWGSTLSIRGDRKFKMNSKKGIHAERAQGSFLHNVLLPKDARPAQISFEFNEGVLIVHLAKNGKTRPESQELGTPIP